MTDFFEIIFDISQKNLESQKQRYKDMDTKAISIITITGILTSFLVGSDRIISNTIDSSGSCISRILYIFTALSFLLTVLLSVWVIKVQYVKAFDTTELLDILGEQNSNESNFMDKIIFIYNQFEHDFYEKCNSKGEKLSYSIYSLGTSVVLLILYSISIFY